MKKPFIFLSIAGSTIAVYAIWSLYSRRYLLQRKKSLVNPRQLLLSFMCKCEETGNDNACQDDVICVTRPRNNPEYDAQAMEDIPSSSSSYTSTEEYEAPSSGQTDSSNNSASSTVSEDGASVKGSVGVSTYGQASNINVNGSDFQTLLHSPVVLEHVSDERMQRRASNETRGSADIVVDYDRTTSPSVLDESIEAIYGTYHNIVLPLQPNTGAVITDH